LFVFLSLLLVIYPSSLSYYFLEGHVLSLFLGLTISLTQRAHLVTEVRAVACA